MQKDPVLEEVEPSGNRDVARQEVTVVLRVTQKLRWAEARELSELLGEMRLIEIR